MHSRKYQATILTSHHQLNQAMNYQSVYCMTYYEPELLSTTVTIYHDKKA